MHKVTPDVNKNYKNTFDARDYFGANPSFK